MTKEEHITLSRNNCNGKITGTGNDLCTSEMQNGGTGGGRGVEKGIP